MVISRAGVIIVPLYYYSGSIDDGGKMDMKMNYQSLDNSNKKNNKTKINIKQVNEWILIDRKRI